MGRRREQRACEAPRAACPSRPRRCRARARWRSCPRSAAPRSHRRAGCRASQGCRAQDRSRRAGRALATLSRRGRSAAGDWRAPRPHAPSPVRPAPGRTGRRCPGSARPPRAPAVSPAAPRGRPGAARRARAGSSAAGRRRPWYEPGAAAGSTGMGPREARHRHRARRRGGCPGTSPRPFTVRSSMTARRPEAISAPASSPRISTRSTPSPGAAPAASGGTTCTRQPVAATTARSTSGGNADAPAASRTGCAAPRAPSTGWTAVASATAAATTARRRRGRRAISGL